MNVDSYKIDGNKGEAIALDENIFGTEPNGHLVYQSVRIHLANRRQGTSKSKERAEVRGGGKKPWRQKGRGGARAGSSRSPLWVGGGTIFGPKPRNYRMKFPIKMRQLARKSALSLKAQDQQIMIVDDFTVNEVKTKQVYDILRALKLDTTKTVLLVPAYDKNLWLSGRNISNLQIMEAAHVSTYDILNNQMLLIQKSAIPVLAQTFTKI
jgi:large subunit ribosomal protein L4